MSTYLSIDIDFWNWQVKSTAERDLDRLFWLASKLQIPTIAVMNHQQLTGYVTESKARKLVNIDTHSDLGDRWVSRYNCGSWVSYVPWRTEGEYKWIHRHSLKDGECNFPTSIFMPGTKAKKSLIEWKEASHNQVEAMPSPSKLLRNCSNIGFVLSPSYCDDGLEDVFRYIVGKYKLQYAKGVRDEFNLGPHRVPYSKPEPQKYITTIEMIMI